MRYDWKAILESFKILKPYPNTKPNLFKTKPNPEKEVLMIERVKICVESYLLSQLVKS